MPTALNGTTELHYETFGSPVDPPLLLIMGLGAQMISWQEGFCSRLVERGYHVIRFDNRDVGLSSKTDAEPPNVPVLVMAALAGGEAPEVPYDLSDMAADAMAVLDALDIHRAHIVGASMGGMIAQTCAIEHPDRVLSLTSIMSTTGNLEVGQPQPEALAALLAPPPDGRDEVIEHSVESFRTLAGPLFDEDLFRAHAAAVYDRAFHPVGAAFQIAAVFASGDRTERLGAVSAPTLVIHGKVDPLITVSGGEATADAIPGARLVIHDEMGHDLPEPLWDTIAEDISTFLHG